MTRPLMPRVAALMPMGGRILEHMSSVTEVRMFVDDITGIGLWPAVSYPLSDTLMAELRAWVDDWTRDFDAPKFDEVAHDWRGHALSLRVQHELGANYRVRFMPQSGVVESALTTEAEAD
jgi:hypothetical protein